MVSTGTQTKSPWRTMPALQLLSYWDPTYWLSAPHLLTRWHTSSLGRNPSSNLRVDFYELRKCCERYSLWVTVRFVPCTPNILGGEKSNFNWDSNPGLLAYCASALITELLSPDIPTDSRTPVYQGTYTQYSKRDTVLYYSNIQ